MMTVVVMPVMVVSVVRISELMMTVVVMPVMVVSVVRISELTMTVVVMSVRAICLWSVLMSATVTPVVAGTSSEDIRTEDDSSGDASNGRISSEDIRTDDVSGSYVSSGDTRSGDISRISLVEGIQLDGLFCSTVNTANFTVDCTCTGGFSKAVLQLAGILQ